MEKVRILSPRMDEQVIVSTMRAGPDRGESGKVGLGLQHRRRKTR